MSRLFPPSLLAALLFSTGCQHTTSPVTAPATASTTAPASGTGYGAVPATTSSDTTYVFGWGELPLASAKPRGGTTRGTPVTLAPDRALPLTEITRATSAFEKDRAAILALAGDYRVSFHFMESLGLTGDYKPVRPYHSWATEHVRVIEDRGRFISLQHTLVMFFRNPDGSDSAPMTMKHWRQDWTYEDSDLHTFRGQNTWARRRPDASETAGAWSQAVFQVDDSPRYEALGRWEHRSNLSAWTSERAWRPLPRREHTVRNDYDVMEGVHRIIFTPTGWLHEQNNWKRVAGEATGESSSSAPGYVAAEIGLDRYERISAPSLSAADRYWEKTSAYWAIVRRIWNETFAQRERFTLQPSVEGKQLFELHFSHAGKLEEGSPFDPVESEREVRAILAKFLASPR
jgi:hypothetical protein